MFESLTDKLQTAFRHLSSRGKITPKDVRAGLKEVQMALLEADVNYQVVKQFVREVTDEALGEKILSGLNPTQQIVGIVHDKLVKLLGDAAAPIKLSPKPPTVIIMAGLQGSGKTTTAGKLARHFTKQGHKVLMVAGDVYRPAAIEQLKQVGANAGVEVFTMGEANPVDIARAGVAHAASIGFDVVIIDTAGRLQIDEQMMQEVQNIEQSFPATETLLVIDAMTGQEAVNIAAEFGRRLKLDGLILTKLDGDARGGAALSARSVTGVPIKFVGMGEKLEGLEVFHPDRMAQRILGMGDVLTLIEKAQQAVDAEEAVKLQKKMLSAKFDLEDFRQQLANVRKMGPLDQIMKLLPGAAKMGGMMPDEFDEREMDVVDAIINSMTKQERRDPELLNASRKRRIAAGSGTTVQDINVLLKQFRELAKMMKAMSSGKSVNFGGMRLGKM
ncbi:MAG: signal recognition particle protein [Armatimonadia bacterium]